MAGGLDALDEALGIGVAIEVVGEQGPPVVVGRRTRALDLSSWRTATPETQTYTFTVDWTAGGVTWANVTRTDVTGNRL